MVTLHQYPNLNISDPCEGNLPVDRALPGAPELGNVPHILIIIGDKTFPLKESLLWPYPGHKLDNNAKCSINCRLCGRAELLKNAFQPLLHDCVRSFDCTDFHTWKRARLVVSHMQELIGPENLLVRSGPKKIVLHGNPTDTNKLGLGYSYCYRCGETPYYVNNSVSVSLPISVQLSFSFSLLLSLW